MLVCPGFLLMEIFEDDWLWNLAFLPDAFSGPLAYFLTIFSPKASLKNLLSVKENMESIEGIVNSLILRLVRRMTSLSGGDGGKSVWFQCMSSVILGYPKLFDNILWWMSAQLYILQMFAFLSYSPLLVFPFCCQWLIIFLHLLHHFVLGRDDIGNDVQFYVQHLIRKLGKAVYLGQRALLAVSQKIPVIAESVLFSDPFDDKFPDLHQYMFILWVNQPWFLL